MKASASKSSIANRAVRAFFTPSVQLMGRLSFLWKFVVTGVLFLAPLSLVLFHFVVGLTGQIEFSLREVDGVRLLNYSQDLMRHIAPSQQPFDNLSEAKLPSQPTRVPWLDRLDATADAMSNVEYELQPSDQIPHALRSFRDDLRLAREQLNAGESPDEVRLALSRKVQGLIVVIGNHSNLILDPDLDTYYLMDQTVLKLPERLTVLTALGIRLESAHSLGNLLTQENQYELLQATEYLRKNSGESRHGIQFAFDNNPSGNLRPTLMPAAQADQSCTETLLSLLGPSRLMAGADLTQLGHREPLEACVTSSLVLHRKVTDELEHLLWKRIHEFEAKQRYVLWLTAVAVSISVYLLCGTFLAITNVVRDMRRMTSRMSQGDFSMPLTVSSRDELGTLATLFNDVATRLHMANTVIEQDRGQLTDRVAERTAELTTANEELIRTSRFKSEFLATMSHELRTPLNGVLGMNELLLKTTLTEKQREFVDASTTSGRTLLSLINDVLDLSKIEAGKIELDLHCCDLEALAYDVITMFSHRAKQQGISLTCELDPEACVNAMCDDIRVRQVLVNLLGNAMKFTATGSVILESKCVQRDDQRIVIRLAVTDTGLGIPQDKLDRLFSPFSQVDNSTARHYGGTGLGLSITKQLVELMGGSIGVTSRAGAGSTFWIELPFELVHAEVRTGGQRKQLLKGTKVLVVNGLAKDRRQLADCLKDWGCPVEQVDTLREAVDAVSRTEAAGQPFAAVLTDCSWDTGDEFVHLQKLARRPDLPLIGLGIGETDDMANLLHVFGLRHLLCDPIRPSALFNALHSVLSVTPSITSPSQAPESAVHEQSTTFTGHILVAEDNSINQMFVRELLKHCGCVCDITNNGDEALTALQRNRYDLVLMDCQMPEMDGFTATREIRRRETAGELGGHLPVIALTANALKEDRKRCLEAGMDEYLSKPLQAVQLQTMLTKYLAVRSDNQTT